MIATITHERDRIAQFPIANLVPIANHGSIRDSATSPAGHQHAVTASIT